MTRHQALARLTAAGEPYELASEQIDGIPYRAFVNAPTSLRALFEATVSDQTFIVYE